LLGNVKRQALAQSEKNLLVSFRQIPTGGIGPKILTEKHRIDVGTSDLSEVIVIASRHSEFLP
jgi:hypothetical protein